MNLPINPEYEECLKNIDIPIKQTLSVLKNIDINFYNKNKPTFQQDGDLFYHIPDIRPQSYIAAFDIDWTIAHAEGKLYPHVAEPNDIQILPNRKEELTILLKKGYTIALFTNQKVKSMPKKLERVMRMTNLLNKLNIPCYVFIATGDDNYRKPNIGMWEKFKELIGIPIEYAFFVGDASGNPNTCVIAENKKVNTQFDTLRLTNPKNKNGASFCWLNSSLYVIASNPTVRQLPRREITPTSAGEIDSLLYDLIIQSGDADQVWDNDNLYDVINDLLPDEVKPEEYGEYGENPQQVLQIFMNQFNYTVNGEEVLCSSMAQIGTIQELCDFANNRVDGDKVCGNYNKPTDDNWVLVGFWRTVGCLKRWTRGRRTQMEATHFVAFARVGDDEWIRYDSGRTSNGVIPLSQTINNGCPPDKCYYVGGLFVRKSLFGSDGVKAIKNNDKNFRDTDKLFAENIGINYYDIDEFFPKPSIKIEPKIGEKVMVVSVGMPGSGKSSFFENYLADYGFVHVERDTVKEKNRFINLVKRLINEGEELIYIDATNPTVEDRKVFYDLAKKHGYATATVYFVRNGHELNKMRDKGKVPDVVYHKFYNALEPPTDNNTPGELYYFG
jgi:DNA 3'-phosphatase